MSDRLMRVMGELEVHQLNIKSDAPRAVPAELASLDDQVNWLGHMLDTGLQSEPLEAVQDKMDAVCEAIFNAHDTTDKPFHMLLVLREKWPVGSKAKFKVKADKVGANHTYLSIFCTAQDLDDFEDSEAVQRAELQALSAEVPKLKAGRKKFANSSAVHGFVRQAEGGR